MERNSQVLTTEAKFDGATHTASYYVEHGVINVQIGGRLLSTALAQVPAEQTAQELLKDYLKHTQSADWQAH